MLTLLTTVTVTLAAPESAAQVVPIAPTTPRDTAVKNAPCTGFVPTTPDLRVSVNTSASKVLVRLKSQSAHPRLLVTGPNGTACITSGGQQGVLHWSPGTYQISSIHWAPGTPPPFLIVIQTPMSLRNPLRRSGLPVSNDTVTARQVLFRYPELYASELRADRSLLYRLLHDAPAWMFVFHGREPMLSIDRNTAITTDGAIVNIPALQLSTTPMHSARFPSRLRRSTGFPCDPEQLIGAAGRALYTTLRKRHLRLQKCLLPRGGLSSPCLRNFDGLDGPMCDPYFRQPSRTWACKRAPVDAAERRACRLFERQQNRRRVRELGKLRRRLRGHLPSPPPVSPKPRPI